MAKIQITPTNWEPIQNLFHQVGIAAVGWTGLQDTCSDGRYSSWIANGYHGEMSYLEQHLPLAN